MFYCTIIAIHKFIFLPLYIPESSRQYNPILNPFTYSQQPHSWETLACRNKIVPKTICLLACNGIELCDRKGFVLRCHCFLFFCFFFSVTGSVFLSVPASSNLNRFLLFNVNVNDWNYRPKRNKKKPVWVFPFAARRRKEAIKTSIEALPLREALPHTEKCQKRLKMFI